MITKEEFEKACNVIVQYNKKQREKEIMIEQECLICGNKFKGTALINVCPTCYV